MKIWEKMYKKELSITAYNHTRKYVFLKGIVKMLMLMMLPDTDTTAIEKG